MIFFVLIVLVCLRNFGQFEFVKFENLNIDWCLYCELGYLWCFEINEDNFKDISRDCVRQVLL